jgi:hypothetical protein
VSPVLAPFWHAEGTARALVVLVPLNALVFASLGHEEGTRHVLVALVLDGHHRAA